MRLDEINLLDLDAFAGGFPHDWFTHLRRFDPVHRHPEPNGPGFWVVTKYEDVHAVSRDPVTYSSDKARGGVAPIDGPLRTDVSGFKPLLMMDARRVPAPPAPPTTCARTSSAGSSTFPSILGVSSPAG